SGRPGAGRGRPSPGAHPVREARRDARLARDREAGQGRRGAAAQVVLARGGPHASGAATGGAKRPGGVARRCSRRSPASHRRRAGIRTPIRSGGRQLGILYVDSRRVGSLLSEKDLGLLSAFAALAGSALQNARLIDDLRHKSELLAHMAHEFRSPLQAIALRAGIGKVRPATGEDLEAIASQSARLSTIVERTLEL